MNKLILKTTKSGLVAAALMASISASAETIEVKTLKYAGPYAVAQPWMADSVNIKGEAFDLKQLLDSPLSFTLLNKGKEVTAALPTSRMRSIWLLSAFLTPSAPKQPSR